MITVDHPSVYPTGVYLGLPEHEYHAALALSASGIKNLRVSPLDWYMRSPLNPFYEGESTEQMIYGTAAHYRTLFGREAFYQRYAPSLDPKDYPDCVRTNEELAVAIINAGGPKPRSNMRKAELVDMLLSFSPDARIWEDIVRTHAELHAGKTFLSQESINHIEVAAAMIEKHPDLGRAFRDGAPEVSIFWIDEETGVPCKARIDYLKPRLVVDLKTFSNPYSMPIDKAIARAMANYKYHVQAAWYLEAARRRDIPWHPAPGTPLDDDHIREHLRLMGSDQAFLFVFQQQGIAPVARGKLFGSGMVMDIARQEIAQARETWARCWETFGPDEPWIDVTGISEFDDTEFPAYIAD